jgi:UTP-glucose-1-phosphate uridylyltransferase
MFKPTIVVMAAGIGSRYGGLKQIDPIGPNGEIIIDYSIYDALNAGFRKVVFVIKEDIEEAFRARMSLTVEQHCETTYVLQALDDLPDDFQVPPARIKPWGTGHAILSCRNAVDSPFAVINADDFYGPSSYQTLYRHLYENRDRVDHRNYCMVGYVLENTLTEHGHVARGVCTVDHDGYLVEITELTRIEKSGEVARYAQDDERWVEITNESIVSMNMWGFTPSLFSELQSRFPRFLRENGNNIDRAEFYLPSVVGDLVREKRATVKVLPTNERWFGVTYRQDRPQVRQAIRTLIRRCVYPKDLWGSIS